MTSDSGGLIYKDWNTQNITDLAHDVETSKDLHTQSWTSCFRWVGGGAQWTVNWSSGGAGWFELHQQTQASLQVCTDCSRHHRRSKRTFPFSSLTCTSSPSSDLGEQMTQRLGVTDWESQTNHLCLTFLYLSICTRSFHIYIYISSSSSSCSFVVEIIVDVLTVVAVVAAVLAVLVVALVAALVLFKRVMFH